MAPSARGERRSRGAFTASSLLLLLLPLLPAPAQAQADKLYRGRDRVVVLEAGSAQRLLRNSTSAWVVEFYSSWCGHCVNYAPTWKALAGDVRDWELAMRIGVLDCADENNFATCKEFGIHFYPTFRYFKALATQFTVGENYKGPDRELQTVRQIMIDFLQNHTSENKPPAWPELEAASSSSILSLLDKPQKHYTAVVFEKESSYVGREVILDLMQYENIVVKRGLDVDQKLMEKLGINSVPSCYVFHPNGSHGLVYMQKPLRSFFSSYIKSLSGVTKRLSSLRTLPVSQNEDTHTSLNVWKEFDKRKMYMADLESGLHYLLRVELASHKILEGSELKTLKDFVAILSKLFPGRQPVVKLLETLQEWLVSLPLDKIPYDAILDLVNNKMRISGMFLTNRIQWVSCQGSKSLYRGYPCSLWTLFHTLTVQAAKRHEILVNSGFDDSPQIVLQVIRRYIHHFFGCMECAQHFEQMAKESMDKVETLDSAILWLWTKHNEVNSRLAGAPSEDPKFPKVSWPNPDLCPDCHEEVKGLHVWKEADVLTFLKSHYGADNLSYRYTEDETKANGAAESRGREGGQKVTTHQRKEDNLQILAQNTRPGIGEKLEKASSLADVKRKSGDRDIIGPKKESKQSVSFFGIGFSNVDMSLCVVLYAASCFFLMIMYFYFRIRSKRWKTRYTRPYV
ncbi:sulfhydryl oxidase 2 isoform X2 [Callorhinchus milii]|uniref:Sulfhydryl oxidase n=1 Tax=Callorhinchus milii TaxID=7868 RepID=A0A4W3GCF2_CALMI|nr:sulfhydryl oxidase 2 isoform X2 [Callorhinchus milii]|eukprot:gi/632964628/ref/XP_007898490.1/ PREDICTED: sulfhydryl oxidase 2 [Callorhinchus milii]